MNRKTNAVPPVRPDYDQPNYDRTKIAPYTLEDPLVFADGSPVKTPADWKRRRQEIVNIFAEKMYGAIPPKPETLVTELYEEKADALGGFAIRSQYRMYFKPNHEGPEIDWLVIRPRYAKGPVPVILFLNYKGNHELLPDEEVLIPQIEHPFLTHKHLEIKRGILNNPNHVFYVPIADLIARGYAVMTACYRQISPDPETEEEPRFSQENFAYRGVFELWGKRDESRRDNTTALGAWGWMLSRGLDLAERIPAIDAKRNLVTGYSRLGKAAIIAASRDERFAVCAPVQCGGGGITLSKRDFGENIGTEMRMFRHWYCKNYGDYAKNPAKLLDFDQHLLVASIAPRRLLVAGFEEQWFDTEGEYLACRAASPVWEFLGRKGMPGDHFPELFETSAIGPDLGYYHRPEAHGMAAFDWLQIIRFAGF